MIRLTPHPIRSRCVDAKEKKNLAVGARWDTPLVPWHAAEAAHQDQAFVNFLEALWNLRMMLSAQAG